IGQIDVIDLTFCDAELNALKHLDELAAIHKFDLRRSLAVGFLDGCVAEGRGGNDDSFLRAADHRVPEITNLSAGYEVAVRIAFALKKHLETDEWVDFKGAVSVN